MSFHTTHTHSLDRVFACFNIKSSNTRATFRWRFFSLLYEFLTHKWSGGCSTRVQRNVALTGFADDIGFSQNADKARSAIDIRWRSPAFARIGRDRSGEKYLRIYISDRDRGLWMYVKCMNLHFCFLLRSKNWTHKAPLARTFLKIKKT